MLFEFVNDSINDKKRLYSDEEGFLKGNMFPELYDEYKNYKPRKLNPLNERDLLLYKIMSLDFAINDLNLYLALHPNDITKYNTFKQYIMALNRYINEYENKYQILDLYHDTNNQYSWNSNPYPWDKKEKKYV